MADNKNPQDDNSPKPLHPDMEPLDMFQQGLRDSVNPMKQQGNTIGDNSRAMGDNTKAISGMTEALKSDRKQRNQSGNDNEVRGAYRPQELRHELPPRQPSPAMEYYGNYERPREGGPKTQYQPNVQYASAKERYSTAYGTTGKPLQPHLGGTLGQSVGGDFNKNLLQMGHMMSPMSFMQYALMFGAGFPLQMKMAETLTTPVTAVAEKYETGRGFATGFTGIKDAVSGFTQQLSKSPFNMYEGMYQSKILLSSALGGERQSDKALDNALKMAREYPVKTEQVLSSLSRLAVYPQAKPYLKNEDFQKKLMESVSGLSLIVPEQGMEGAMFSLIEAMSGSWRSLQMRFNVSPEIVESLSGMSKGEMASDPNKLIEGLHKFIGKSVGLDVLEKQKYTFTKQVDNFGDSLQLLTRSVFEQTGLYKTITAGATAFATGFSSLAENKTFLNFIGRISQPFQERTDSAVAKFVGMPTGLFKQTPLSQVTKVLEENFKELSYEEIGGKFETLIDDMGGIWKDTTKGINTIINRAFGKTLSDIGGDIANVAASSFNEMVWAVVKGMGTNLIENPMDSAKVLGMIAMPLMAVIGGAHLGVGMMQKFFSGETMGTRFMKLEDKMFGTHKFRTSSAMTGASTPDYQQYLELKGKSKAFKDGQIKLDESMLKTAKGDDFLQDKLFSKGNQADVFDGKFKRSDTKGILQKIADISAENIELLNTDLLRTTKSNAVSAKKASSGFGLADIASGKTPIPLEAHQLSKLNATLDSLHVSTLGLDAQTTSKYSGKKLTDVSMADFKKSNVWKNMTVADTELADILKSDLKDRNKIVRNIIEEEIYKKAEGTTKGKFVDAASKLQTSDYAIGTQYTQTFNAARFNELMKDVAGSGKETGKMVMGNVKEIVIDNPKHVSILNDMLETTGSKWRVNQGYSQITPQIEIDKSYDAYRNSKAYNSLDTGAKQDFLDANLAYREAFKQGDKKINTWNKGAWAVQESTGVSTDNIKNYAKSNALADMIDNFDDYRLNSKSVKRMMGVLGGEGVSDKMQKMDLGGYGTLGDLRQNRDFYKFQTSPDEFLKELTHVKAGSSAGKVMLENAARGTKAFKFAANSDEIGDALTGSGGVRFKAAQMYSKITNNKFFSNLANTGIVKGVSPYMAAGLAGLDVPMIGFRAKEIAENFGVSNENANLIGVGAGVNAAGAVGIGGGILATTQKKTWMEGIKTLLGLAPIEKDAAGKAIGGFAKRGITSAAGMVGMTGVYSAIDAILGYSESVKTITDRQNAFSKDLLKYDLGTKDYAMMMESGGQIKDQSLKGALTDPGKREKGFENVKNDWGSIAMTAAIAGGVALAVGLTGGAALGAVIPALGVGAIAGGGTAVGSYFKGTGNQTDEEKWAASSISGFLGNRKFFTDQSRGIEKEMSYLQEKEGTTGLTVAETAKLKNLEIDKAKIDVMSTASLEGAKEVSNITSAGKNFIDPSKKVATGTMKDFENLPMYGGFKPNGSREDYLEKPNKYSTEEQNILGYAQQLDKRKDRTPENKIGSYLALQSYALDQYNPKVKEVFDKEKDPEKVKEKAKNYAEVVTTLGNQYNDTMGSVNLQDPNQVEIMKQARMAFIKGIQVPVENQDAMNTVRTAVSPMLMKDFFKADTLSAVSSDKSIQNSQSEIAGAIKNKIAQFGINDPNQMLTQSWGEWSNNTPTKFGKDFNANSLLLSNRPKGEQGRNLDFVKNITGKDLTKQEVLSDTDLETLKSDDTRKSYIKEFGTDRDFNKLNVGLKDYKESNEYKKKEYFDTSKTDIVKGMMSSFSGKEFDKSVESTQRNLNVLKDKDFTKVGFSGVKGEELNTQRDRAQSAFNKMTGADKNLKEFVVAQQKAGNKNFEGIKSDDGFDDAEMSKISKAPESASFMKDLAKSKDDYEKAMLVVSNSTNTTSEMVEGKLGQSLEKVGKLFGIVSTSGQSMSKLDLTNKLREEIRGANEAVTGLKLSGEMKQEKANDLFSEYKDKGVDFEGLGKNIGAPINSMQDLVNTDADGISNLAKLNKYVDAGGKESESRYGLTSERFKNLGEEAANYNQGKSDVSDAVSKQFNTNLKLGEQLTSLTVTKNPMFETANKLATGDYGAQTKIRNAQYETLSMATTELANAKSPEERAKWQNTFNVTWNAIPESDMAKTATLMNMVGRETHKKAVDNTVSDTLVNQENLKAGADILAGRKPDLVNQPGSNVNGIAPVSAAALTGAVEVANKKTEDISKKDEAKDGASKTIPEIVIAGAQEAGTTFGNAAMSVLSSIGNVLTGGNSKNLPSINAESTTDTGVVSGVVPPQPGSYRDSDADPKASQPMPLGNVNLSKVNESRSPIGDGITAQKNSDGLFFGNIANNPTNIDYMTKPEINKRMNEDLQPLGGGINGYVDEQGVKSFTNKNEKIQQFPQRQQTPITSETVQEFSVPQASIQAPNVNSMVTLETPALPTDTGRVMGGLGTERMNTAMRDGEFGDIHTRFTPPIHIQHDNYKVSDRYV